MKHVTFLPYTKLVRAQLCALIFACTFAARSAAAGGYYAGNRGAHATGRAGAFVAKADDLSAVIYNPAGLAALNTTLVQVADRLSSARQQFTRASTINYGTTQVPPPVVSFAPVSSGGFRGLDPLLAVGTNFGLRGWGFALAAYAPPGSAGADYPLDGGTRYLTVSSQAVMLNYALSAAYRFSDNFGVGVSLQAVTLPSLKYRTVVNASPFPRLAQPVSSVTDMLATVEVSDSFTPNATLGVWARPLPWLELGVSGQVIPADIVAKGKLSIDPVQPLAGADGVDLYRVDATTGAELPPSPVELTLPLPLFARAGARYVYDSGAREWFDVELDIVYEGWSRVQQLHLATRGLHARYGVEMEISDIDSAKHWKDTVAVALGSQVLVLPERLQVRAGVAYETPTADVAYANLDAPAGATMTTALGASVYLAGFELSVALEYQRQASVTVSEADGRIYQTQPSGTCQPPYTDVRTCHPALIAGGRPAPTVNAGLFQSRLFGATLELAYRF